MFILEECTVDSIRAAFEGGELTAHALVLMYLERIATIDQSGPHLNAVLEVNPDALFIAAAMDRERAAGKVRSPLHGVPVLLKDNINTADKLCTSAGSLALADHYATYDASLVARLRAAGAVILGKANMTELANFMSYTMKSGYSSRGGQVVNPYKAGAEVWGSSTGSAVAVSANLCALAVGTETNGSIISPSFINGSVGIKPTLGLVSRHGIVPVCIAQDTAGPMTRTVADAAALLNVLVGHDAHDPATWCLEDKIPADYTTFLNPHGLKGLRVGVNWHSAQREHPLMPFTEAHTALAHAALDVMGACGAEIIHEATIPFQVKDLDVMLYEFRKCLNAYLSTTNPANPVRKLEDLIAFYTSHPKEGLKYGMSILLDAQHKASGNLTDAVYLEARARCLQQSQAEGLDKVFAEHNLDVLVSPMLSGLAPISGYPSICVPAGYLADGTPYGMIFVGKPFSEPLLIAAAYAYEQASHMRKAPQWAL